MTDRINLNSGFGSVEHQVNNGAGDGDVEPHGKDKPDELAVGGAAVGPPGQISKEDEGEADGGERDVRDEQRKINWTDPPGAGEFGLVTREMVGDIAEQEQT